MSMLRGMGLKDEEICVKNATEAKKRPRRMGLDANDTLTKPKKLLVTPAANEVLEIRKNAKL